MLQAVLMVVVLILVVGYAVFFAFWNPEAVWVVGFQWGGMDRGMDMPTVFLPLIGLAVGAVVMALSLWAPWAAMRRAALGAKGQLDLERQKSNERAKKVNALSKEVKQLKAELAKAKQQGEGGSAPTAPC
jgi:type VI protein secretion system component VasK